MLANAVKVTCALLLCGAVLALSGCACCETKACPKTKPPCEQPQAAADEELAAALPPHAKPGECYAKVYIPPEYKTVTERVMVRDSYDQLEVVPAKYEWVEETILVKDSCKELQVMAPQFATREQTFEVQSASTEWEVNKNPRCVAYPNQPARDIFCLVSHPCVQKTVQAQCLAKPACVQEVTIPAEYQTVRRQKLVCPATTRKVCVPAEFTEIQKTVKVCDGRIAWKLVNCDGSTPGTVGAATSIDPPPPPPPARPPARPPVTANAAKTRSR